MRGTLVYAMTEDDAGAALATAAELSDRLDLRLVLVHVGDGGEARTDVADHAEERRGAGDAAAVIGRIAAEEAADLIVVCARARGRFRRGLDSRLAGQLGSETPVPVLIAPALTSRS